MYAETFNVQGKYETAAKWLRWAMQGMPLQKYDEVRYNLGQFWGELEARKAEARTPRDWGDLLTLNSQSQWALGQLYESDINALLKTMNDARLWSSTIYALKKDGWDEKRRSLQAAREKAHRASQDFADQAAKAYSQAQVSNPQAANTRTVATGALFRDTSLSTSENRTAESIGAGTNLLDAFKVPFLGLPVWAWGAALVGILLLMPGPRVVLSSARREPA